MPRLFDYVNETGNMAWARSSAPAAITGRRGRLPGDLRARGAGHAADQRAGLTPPSRQGLLHLQLPAVVRRRAARGGASSRAFSTGPPDRRGRAGASSSSIGKSPHSRRGPRPRASGTPPTRRASAYPCRVRVESGGYVLVDRVLAGTELAEVLVLPALADRFLVPAAVGALHVLLDFVHLSRTAALEHLQLEVLALVGGRLLGHGVSPRVFEDTSTARAEGSRATEAGRPPAGGRPGAHEHRSSRRPRSSSLRTQACFEPFGRAGSRTHPGEEVPTGLEAPQHGLDERADATLLPAPGLQAHPGRRVVLPGPDRAAHPTALDGEEDRRRDRLPLLFPAPSDALPDALLVVREQLVPKDSSSVVAPSTGSSSVGCGAAPRKNSTSRRWVLGCMGSTPKAGQPSSPAHDSPLAGGRRRWG